jgi:hypothetical protein
MGERSRALEKLAPGSHASLVALLSDVIEKDQSIVLRKRAAQLLANQPANAANAALRKLLKDQKVVSQPVVAAELVRALARCGYDSKQWSDVEKLFDQGYEAERVPLHEAVLDLVVEHKEKKAVELLLRNLDEPGTDDVEHPDNPPAEYWEARWKAWAVWRGKVKDALFAITGQRFSTTAEARAWLKQNPLR